MTRRAILKMLLTFLMIWSPAPQSVWAQSGRSTNNGEKSALLNLIIHNTKSNEIGNFSKDQLALYDGGIEQEIDYLRADPTGARIIVLIDISQTLRTEKIQLQKSLETFIQALQQDDQMMIIGFNEQAEILVDFTSDNKTLNSGANQLKHEGYPKLYDALSATVEDAFRKQLGVNKRAIILISDGYDRDSKIKYENILAMLLNENIIVYGIQIPDRTFGAIRARNTGPKPTDALTNIVELTGGVLFKLDKLDELTIHAQEMINEIHNNWYTLAYLPKGVNFINSRRLLIVSPNADLKLRTKKLQPAQSHP